VRQRNGFLASPTALPSGPSDVRPVLLYLIGDARLVWIAEAAHGTDEFYSIRAASTKALIRSKQFNVVAAEADWPDAYRVKWAHNSRLGDARAQHGF
jgi:erythromycin esterase-like protein